MTTYNFDGMWDEDAQDAAKRAKQQTGFSADGYNLPVGQDTQLADNSNDVTGSNFINFARLYNTNSGKSAQMAQGLSNNARDASSKAKGDAAKAREDFDSKANGSVTPYGQVKSNYQPTGQTTSTSSTTGTSQQALMGTPQKGGDPGGHGVPPQPTAPAGSITPTEASARAGQQGGIWDGGTQVQSYTGPDGLADFDKLMQQGVDADQRAAALGSTEGRQALLADMQHRNADSQGSRFNGALAGTAGGDVWQRLSNQFGGNADYVNDLQNHAQDFAQNQKDVAAATNARRQADIDKWNTNLKAPGRAANNGYRLDPAKVAADLKKDKTYDQWVHEDDAADYLHRSGTYFSPIDMAMHAAGKKGITDMLTEGWEKNLGNPIGDSSNITTRDEFNLYAPDMQRKIYDSLTQAEVNKLNGMQPGEVRDFLAQRARWLASGWTPDKGNY